MSRISDHKQRAAAALDHAAAIGMPREEIELWRRDLDPATLDLCGCRAGLMALAVTLAIGMVAQWVIGFGFGRTGLCLIAAIIASAATKAAQSTRAEAQFKARLQALTAASIG